MGRRKSGVGANDMAGRIRLGGIGSDWMDGWCMGAWAGCE